ncbi:hypothetical protein [Pseudomonas sp. M30-35]|uniref:hypothetical protein n=1 Tax=Pseudomonas sp. M30-35 TaxID=1981174 RepID=UPI000B3D4A7B|nr:hypothetical protein [Pseudomonas sp. M30-35]ARU86678.1 hypothetical protein B9K09_01150 [Pseudomonas sp. M30-35]
MSTAELVIGYLSCLIIFSMLIWLGVMLHMAYTKLDMMLEYLKNCPAVMTRAPFKKGGPAGRLFVLSGIIGVVTRPKIYLRDGGAIATDLDKFPVGLKRKLAFFQATGWVLLGAMVLIWLIAKLTDKFS